jgi:hypothetical protein
MKSLISGLIAFSVLATATLSVASDTPALVVKHGIRKVKTAENAELRSFHDYLRKTYKESNENSFLVNAVLRIKDTERFGRQQMVQLINGRINDFFELDLSISDSEAATRSMVVIKTESLFRPDQIPSFVKFFMPFENWEDAEAQGLGWSRKDLAETKRRLTSLLRDKSFQIHSFNVDSGYDASVSLLGFYDEQDRELLLIGFGTNP